MSDKELEEIAEKGDSQQRKKAREILDEREYQRVNNQLIGIGNELGAQVDSITESVEQVPEPPEESILPEGLDSAVAVAEVDLQVEIDVAEATLEQNLVTNNNTLQTKNAQKSGDPVKITEGSYEQEEFDFQFSGPMDFQIKRRYSSSGEITSSFGYGWYSNLD